MMRRVAPRIYSAEAVVSAPSPMVLSRRSFWAGSMRSATLGISSICAPNPFHQQLRSCSSGAASPQNNNPPKAAHIDPLTPHRHEAHANAENPDRCDLPPHDARIAQDIGSRSVVMDENPIGPPMEGDIFDIMKKGKPPIAKRAKFPPDFYDHNAYATKTVGQLINGLAVLYTCRIKFLTIHGPMILKRLAGIFGEYLTYETVVKWTFFKHFCAGTDEKSIVPVLDKLENSGIGAILDYAAEAEVPLFSHNYELDISMQSLITRTDLIYKPELEYEENLKIFLRCIDHARNGFPMERHCFAAVKFTGLVDPQLLAKMSAILLQLRQGWIKLFTNEPVPPLEDCRVVAGRKMKTSHRFASRKVAMQKFKQVCGEDTTDKQCEELCDYLIAKGVETGRDQKTAEEVDYLVYTQVITRAIIYGENPEPLKPLIRQFANLREDEKKMVQAFRKRLITLMDHAVEKNVFVMVDAEQTFYQMSIDCFVRELQRQYNCGKYPMVYNTYQCYLTIAEERIDNDLERSNREGWKWAGKLVRGAYVEQERATAAKYKYNSPIWDAKEKTDTCYNTCCMKLCDRIADKSSVPIGVLFGTHNVHSCNLICDRIKNEKLLEKSDSVLCFGQLFGMTDFISFPLARASHEYNYRVFKYVPYGPVPETMEYLARRAKENSAVAGATSIDTKLMWEELWCRLKLRNRKQHYQAKK